MTTKYKNCHMYRYIKSNICFSEYCGVVPGIHNNSVLRKLPLIYLRPTRRISISRILIGIIEAYWILFPNFYWTEVQKFNIFLSVKRCNDIYLRIIFLLLDLLWQRIFFFTIFILIFHFISFILFLKFNLLQKSKTVSHFVLQYKN